jgi:prepilin-type N-terminal cleavage/methylation domain-containing protein
MHKKAFTLIELIIVIAIIAILAAAIFVAIDPARRLHESRNATRRTDVATILDALLKYQADNNGIHYSTVESLSGGLFFGIGTNLSCSDTDCGSKTIQGGCVNLSALPDNYLANIPFDPLTGNDGYTDYYLGRMTGGALTVGACDVEGEGAGGASVAPSIELTR